LARSEEERTEVLNLESAVETNAADRQRRADGAFLADVKPLNEAVERLSGSETMSDDSRRQLLKKTRLQLESLLATHLQASSAVRRQTDAIRTRLDAVDEEIETRRRQKAALNALIVNVRKTEDYKRAAQTYINAHQDSVMADDLKRVVDEAPLWESVEAWTQFLSRSEFRSLRKITAQQASALMVDGDKLMASNANVPLSSEYTRRLPILKAIAARLDDEKQPLQASLGRLRRDTLISNVWMLGLTDGKRYYLEDEPDLDEEDNLGRAVIEHLNGLDFSTKRTSVPVKDVVYNDVAPQSKVMNQIVQEVERLKPEEWESRFLNAVQGVRKDKYLDPIIEYLLLKRVLAIACQGSLPLKEVLGEYCEELEAAPIDVSVNWLDPSDEDARAMRTRIRTVLGRCPSLEEAAARVQAKVGSLYAPPPPPLLRAGLMARQEEGGWVYLGQNDSSDSGTMFVVLKNVADDMAIDIEEVGTINAGAFSWKEPFDKRYLGGRPIFLRAAAESGQ
jgi:hypothetical protein